MLDGKHEDCFDKLVDLHMLVGEDAVIFSVEQDFANLGELVVYEETLAAWVDLAGPDGGHECEELGEVGLRVFVVSVVWHEFSTELIAANACFDFRHFLDISGFLLPKRNRFTPTENQNYLPT
jgi:hypothetical protein